MILENADIKVEYELDGLGNVVRSTISKQDTRTNKLETTPRKFERGRINDYKYTDKDITLDYKIICRKSDFKVKVTGFNLPKIEELKLLMWLSADFVEYVLIDDDNYLKIGLDEDFWEEGEDIEPEFIDALSKDFIFNIKTFKDKGIREFIFDTIYQFRGSSVDELRLLISYIKSALN